jgi:hypothetical protein
MVCRDQLRCPSICLGMSNREVPKFSDEPETREQGLQVVLHLRPTNARAPVVRFADWDISAISDPASPDRTNILAVGIGEPQVVPFDDSLLETALRWLAADENAWLDVLPRAMVAGSIVYPELLPDDDDTVEGLRKLLIDVGDFALSHPETLDGEQLPAVDALWLARQLSSLRKSLLFTLAMRNYEKPTEFYARLEKQIDAIDPEAGDALRQTFGSADDSHSALARMFLLADRTVIDVSPLISADSPGGPLRTNVEPYTPQQVIWFTIALSAGAIVPPSPMSGVFRCGYQLCQKLFVSKRLGVGGTHRFCSVAHGKRFHAARRMKAKAKRKRPQEKSED